MSLDDFAPADDSADDLDEDLFDFPPMQSSGSSPVGGSAPDAASHVGSDIDGPSAALPSSDPFDDDLGSIDMGVDAEDEDLFGFPPVDGPASPFDAPPMPPEADPSEGPESLEQALETDIDELIREVKSETSSTRTQEPVTQPEDDELSGAAPEPCVTTLPSAAPQPQAMAPLGFLPGAVPKALWVFTGAAILFMGGLLIIAWNLTSAFQQQIAASRNSTPLVESVPQQPSFAGSIPAAGPDAQTTAEPRVSLPSAPRLELQPKQPGSLDQPHESILIVAESAIDEGRFVEARRMLFMLLAEVDRIPATSRELAEEQASFLIARSHKSEAELLPRSSE